MSRVKVLGWFTAYDILPGRLYQRGKMHGHGSREKGAALQALGIGMVLGMAPREPDAGLEELSRAGLLEYVHVPIPDGKLDATTGAALLLLAAGAARRAANGGFAVLTHCNAGRNRSGLMSALLLREWLGLSGAEAMTHVRAARPRALANPAFEAFLAGLPPLEVHAIPAPEGPEQPDLFNLEGGPA